MRPVDADRLIEKWEMECGTKTTRGTCEGDCFDCHFPEAIVDLKDAPTIDAVPVVASDRNKLCPINHGLRCKDIDNCAFWCEWGQCAVKAIAVACADGERTHG